MNDNIRRSRPVRPSLIREFGIFLREHKKWWLAPVLLVILVMAVLVFIGGSGGAPFIYTLF